MTTITISTSLLLAIEVGILFLVSLLAVLLATGVLRCSFSIGAIPPWNRKPAVRKTDSAVPAAAEPSAGTAVPRPIKRGSVA